MDKLVTVVKWAGPAVALLAVHGATAGIPTLPVAAMLVGGGVLLSWGVPKLIKFVKSKLG